MADNAPVFRHKDGVVALVYVYVRPTPWPGFSLAGAWSLSTRAKGAEHGRTAVGFLAAPARHLQ